MLLSKKKKLAKEKELQQEKARAEAKAKFNIRKTLATMKGQSNKLNQFKKDYIAKARQALSVSDERSYSLAKSGLKLCLSKQRYLDSMITNFEISMQINDMNAIIGDFVSGINTISKQMKELSANFDLSSAQQAYDEAILNNEDQFQALDSFLTTAAESISSYDKLDTSITDDEIDNLITNQAANLESEQEKELDAKIVEMRNKILTTSN